MRRNGEQHEGRGQRHLQQACLALTNAERKHRNDRRGGERDLLGRLRDEVGPGEAMKACGKGWRAMHDKEPDVMLPGHHRLGKSARPPGFRPRRSSRPKRPPDCHRGNGLFAMRRGRCERLRRHQPAERP
jgi:hypothetical protein